jgi:hypothetical protein
MPLDDAETFSRTLQQYRKTVTDLQQTVPHIGTERDQNARERVRRLRTLASTMEGKLDSMLPADDAARDRAWDDLRSKYTQLKQDFETANTTVKRKERQSVGPAAAATAGASSSTAMNSMVDDGRSSPRSSAGTTAEVRVQAIKQVDNSELYTKEALEREKLQGALESKRKCETCTRRTKSSTTLSIISSRGSIRWPAMCRMQEFMSRRALWSCRMRRSIKRAPAKSCALH